MSAPSAHWLPRAERDNGRGDLLRRSFEDRLERREDATPDLFAARLERLRLAELERRAALAAFAELPEDVRAILTGVLALPTDAQAALSALLA